MRFLKWASSALSHGSLFTDAVWFGFLVADGTKLRDLWSFSFVQRIADPFAAKQAFIDPAFRSFKLHI
jgi:hypothetical protein